MKLIEFKEYNNLYREQSLNRKKMIGFSIVGALVIIIAVFFIVYVCSSSFRNWADMHVLMKRVNEGSVSSVDLDYDSNYNVFAYDKYVAILSENKLNIYNSSAKNVAALDVSLSNPKSSINGKYMALAENENIYLITSTKIIWNKTIEGSISKVSVNENGYISVVISGTTYKSILIVYDQNGNELFKSYIPDNSVIDSVVSSDNKFFSYAEIDTSGSLIKSTVKTVSIKSAQSSSEDAVVYKYDMPTDELIVNLRYQGSKNLICMTNESVNLLSDGNKQIIMSINDEEKSYTFAGIDLTNSVYRIEEYTDNSGNQKSNMYFYNSGTKKESNYTISTIAKSTVSAGNGVGINCGTEIYFVSNRGWLKKKYVATQEIRSVKMSDRVAAIIFRDKIEILVL